MRLGPVRFSPNSTDKRRIAKKPGYIRLELSMAQRSHKKTKASLRSTTEDIFRDPTLLLSKYESFHVVSLIIGAWCFWWLLRRYQKRASRRVVSPNGYILIYGQLEHRLIAERVLGRRLIPGEVVHHINGIKTDNRESNLCVLDDYEHNRFHDWLSWKVEKDGFYPTKNYQRAVLRDRYNGILLKTYANDLPPLESDTESNRGENASSSNS